MNASNEGNSALLLQSLTVKVFRLLCVCSFLLVTLMSPVTIYTVDPSIIYEVDPSIIYEMDLLYTRWIYYIRGGSVNN